MKIHVQQTKNHILENNLIEMNLMLCLCISGAFEHRFTSTGTYCFWSGYLDIYKTTQFSGVVEVVDRPSTVEQISVTVGGYNALHDIGASKYIGHSSVE